MLLPDAVAATLEMGGMVVTSSPRAARFLAQLHAETKRTRNIDAWRTPKILPWEGWLESLWQTKLQKGGEQRLLLTSLQEHRIWVRLIEPSIEGRHLISTQGVAELAQEAYSLLCGYEALDFLYAGRVGTVDVESFREWALSFVEECRREEWLSRSMLPHVLRKDLHKDLKDLPSLPGRLALVGFDRATPAQQHLVQELQSQGCAVEWVKPGPGTGASDLLIEAAGGREEITACARWVRTVLQAAAQEKRQARVAVIVPDVRRVRAEMERTFRQVLAPQSIAVGEREQPLPFEFSLGVPLGEVPVARAALLLLRWMEQPIRQEELTWLMLSGFLWRHESEFLSSAEFDARLRKEDVLPPERELDLFLRQGRGQRSEALAGLHAARRRWRETANGAHSFSEWAELAEQLLEAAHWPGIHLRESEEFQALKKWAQLLDSIAMLSFDGRQVSYAEFREVLERQARQTIFAPESRGAPVQILGPFEAAGMEFDALWFLGADDANWPPPAQPHPFLTRDLHRRYGMPHADSDADWQMAKRVTERIQNSAPLCVFSYAAQDKNGLCRPSMVLSQGAAAYSAETWIRSLPGAFKAGEEEPGEFPSWEIEEEPASGLRWPVEQDAKGHNTLKMQAACPFQAFATMRLGAREIRRADWGLEPLERGTVLHRILQDLWAELRDRDALVAARESGRLHQIVQTHVERAVSKFQARDQEERWSAAYLAAEQERICRLVEEWLVCEEKREPFTVEQSEQSLSAQVGSLKLKLRADRIDAVPQGRLLIDYKSGKVSAAAWEGARPDEPQMPLYAVYGNVPDVRGVLLAQVRAGDVKFEGQVEDPAIFMPGNTAMAQNPYSEETRQRWEEVLLALAEQFRNGEAQVDPKRYPKTCAFCPLPGLCRVAETDRPWTEEESNGSDGGPDD